MFSEQGGSSAYSGAESSTSSGTGAYGQVNICLIHQKLKLAVLVLMCDDHGNVILPFVSLYFYLTLDNSNVSIMEGR